MKSKASLVTDADLGPLTSKREQDHPSIGCHVMHVRFTTTSTATPQTTLQKSLTLVGFGGGSGGCS